MKESPMLDRTTHLQVSGRITDRHAEARARRLEAEAAASGGRGDRAIWLTDRLHAIRRSAGAALHRVRPSGVRPGTTLTPTRYRA
jgi:hypothetical protein